MTNSTVGFILLLYLHLMTVSTHHILFRPTAQLQVKINVLINAKILNGNITVMIIKTMLVRVVRDYVMGAIIHMRVRSVLLVMCCLVMLHVCSIARIISLL